MVSFEFSKSEAQFRKTVSDIHKLWCECGDYLRHLKPRGGWPTDTTEPGDLHQDLPTEKEGTTEDDIGTEDWPEDIGEDDTTEGATR